jgi:hypothetical protein
MKRRRNPVLLKVNPFLLKVNPFLLKVNPFLLAVNKRHSYDPAPSLRNLDVVKIQRLWESSRKQKPSVSKAKFEEGLAAYVNQHHELPETVTKINLPGVDTNKNPIFVRVGGVKEIVYNVPRHSRKHGDIGYNYKHEMKNECLISNPKGDMIMFSGKMRMKKDGWLHD